MNRDKTEQLYYALAKEKEHRDINRLKLFEPHSSQKDFMKCTAKTRMISSGNQFGKTTIGCVETALWALGEHPYKKIQTPNQGRIITGQGFRTGIEEIIIPKLRSLVGSKDIKKIATNSQGNPIKILWRNGSTTQLMSSDQDDDVFEGDTIDYCWIDEPIRRSIYIATIRGFLSTGGHLWWTATLLDEPWIYDDIYLPAIENRDPEIKLFGGSIDDNPYITENDKNAFLKFLTEDEIEVRRFGHPAHLSGRVFKSYKPEKHKIEPFDIPRHWPVWVAIDPHGNKPHAALFLACAPDGNFYVCNEIYFRGTIEDFGNHIVEIAEQYNVIQYMIDTSAQAQDWTKQSAREILQNKCGIHTRLAQKKNLKKDGIILIEQTLAHGKLFVFEHCKRTHREFQNYTYKKNKRDTAQIMEEPEKKFDDMMDCLRYILIERPSPKGRSRIKNSSEGAYRRIH